MDDDCPEPQEVLAKKPACSLVDNASLGLQLPLPALAACHRRGMVCSKLVPFSPLFWWCLRAFLMVAVPQSGLLAQVSLLRLPSGHSGQILTLSNAQPPLASDRCRHLRCFSAGSYHWTRNLWVLIIYLFFLPVMLPSVVPRLATDLPMRVFPVVWKFLFFKTPFPGRISIPTSFVSLFIFYIFPSSF